MTSLPANARSSAFRRPLARLLPLALTFALARLAAQPVQIDPTFAPVLLNDVPALTSLAFTPLADGSLLVRGDFTHVDGAPVGALARLRPDGTGDSAYATTFARLITLTAPLTDGRLLVVTAAPDYSGSRRLERLLADGSPDSTYSPIELDHGTINRLVPQSDGRILVTGDFWWLGSMARSRLARLRVDGTPDTSFNAGLLLDEWLTKSTALTAQPDGKVLLTFPVSSSSATRYRLARLNADGSTDDTFSATASLSDLAYHALAVQSDGKILAATGAKLLRFNADGTADATFAPALPGFVRASQLVALANAQILVEATVSLAAPPTNSTVIPRSVFLLNASGAVLRDFRTSLPADTSIDLLAVQPDSRLILRYGFPILAYSYLVPVSPGDLPPVSPSTSARSALTTTTTEKSPRDVIFSSPTLALAQPAFARVDLAGTRDAGFAPTFIRRSTPEVYKLATDDDGRLLALGTFTSVNGTPLPGLARFLPDGSLDPTFHPAPQPRHSTSLAFAQPDGQVILHETVLGPKNADGVFSLVNARERLLADGSRDARFASATLPGSVIFHGVDTDGRILASGFAPDASAEANLKLFRLNSDGSVAATLSTRFGGIPVVVTSDQTQLPEAVATVSEATNPVVELQPLSNGKLLIHTRATTINGATVPGFARLNADGSTDATYRPLITPPNPNYFPIIRLLPGGRLMYAPHEEFSPTYYPVAQPSASVLFRADGTRDPSFAPLPGRVVYGDLELSDGKFLSAGGYQRWLPSGLLDLNYTVTYDTGLSITAVEVAGRVYLGGNFLSVKGQPHTGLLRLLSAEMPGFTAMPQNQTVIAGRAVALQAALGTTVPATYQWTRDGVPVPGATGPALILSPAKTSQAGTYRLVATVGAQTYTSSPATLTVTPNTARLVNFSNRSRVTVDGPPQIAGFVLRDRTPHPVLLRAIGLGLSRFNLPSASLLRSPLLRVQQHGTVLAENAGGAAAASIAAIAQRVGAFPALADYYPVPWNGTAVSWPTHDSALSLSLPAGVYTAQTLSADGQSGLNLFEFYDASDAGTAPTVTNLSIRARSAPGSDALIAGFVVSDTGPVQLLLRAVGPELTRLGVSGALADPQLTLRGRYGSELAQNDNWSDQPDAVAIAATASQVGAFALPAGSRDAALLVSLEPGVYTAQVDGAAGTSGEALIELYVVD